MNIPEFLRTKPAGAERGYAPYLRYFRDWLQARSIAIEDASDGDFREFLKSRDWANATQINCRTAVTQYLKWAELEDHPIHQVKIKRTRPRKLPAITPIDYTELLARQDDTPIGVRNQAIIMLAFDAGARVAEIASLRLEDLDLDNLKVTLLRKGGDWDPTPISEPTAAYLRRWIFERRHIAKDHGHVFCAVGGRKPGEPLTVDGLRAILYACFREAGISSSSHAFRRGLAKYLQDAGVPRDEIIEHLGWRDGSMLDYYARHLSDGEAVRSSLPGNMLLIADEDGIRVFKEIEK